MNTDDKIKFIADLGMSILSEVQEHIRNGNIPDEWDGHELRALLAGKFGGEAERTLASDGAMSPRSRRLKNFRNTIATRNI